MVAPRRVVIAGCGAVANAWIAAIHNRPDLDVVGLADPDRQAAEMVRDRFALLVEVHADVHSAVVATGADLVFNTTIPAAHCSVAVAALRLGCDVFVEKPLAATMVEAREMIAAAQSAGRRLSVLQNYRYAHQLRTLHARLHAGVIGEASMYSIDFFRGPHFGGFREEMASPLLLDMAIHTFDAARYLSGANAVSVACREFNPAGSWYEGAAAAVCTFRMADGSVVSYRGCWASRGFDTPWNGAWRITGSVGSAMWDGQQAAKFEGADGTPLDDTAAPDAGDAADVLEGHPGAIDAMARALAEGRPAETDCTDNIHSLAMVLAALESARLDGQPVSVDRGRIPPPALTAPGMPQ